MCLSQLSNNLNQIAAKNNEKIIVKHNQKSLVTLDIINQGIYYINLKNIYNLFIKMNYYQLS